MLGTELSSIYEYMIREYLQLLWIDPLPHNIQDSVELIYSRTPPPPLQHDNSSATQLLTATFLHVRPSLRQSNLLLIRRPLRLAMSMPAALLKHERLLHRTIRVPTYN